MLVLSIWKEDMGLHPGHIPGYIFCPCLGAFVEANCRKVHEDLIDLVTVFSWLWLCGCVQEDSEQTPERVLQSTTHLPKSGCCGGQRARFVASFTSRHPS